MLMKKLSEEHYIVVDDSDIKIGDVVAERLLTGEYELFTIQTLNDIDEQTQIKITHSTQPESFGTGWMQSIQPLFLSEVEELLGVVDVEKKAKNHLDEQYNNEDIAHPELYDAYHSFLKGYNEALEDNKEKKYTEEDMRKAYYQGHKSGLGSENGLTFEHTIQSLQHKTEWEVEFVDGKLKLKS